METLDAGILSQIKIGKTDDPDRFRLSLQATSETKGLVSIRFETDGRGVVAMMRGLEQFQATHKIPIPDGLRPKRGRPTLAFVSE
jgi:hypothetical protein